jgi:hypothetical protein
MRRLIIAGLLFSGAVLGTAGPVGAVDYAEPVVPEQFLLAPPPPVVAAVDAPLRLQVLHRENGEVVQGPEPTGAGLPVASAPPIRACDRWNGDGGGRALWDWNTC